MGVRVARGLFRLWVVFSVVWIAGAGAVTWQTLPADWSQFKSAAATPKGDDVPDWAKDHPVVAPKSSTQFDPDAYLASRETVTAPKGEAQFVPDDLPSLEQKRRAAIQFAVLLAMVPPIAVLILGLAFRWAFIGFRP